MLTQSDPAAADRLLQLAKSDVATALGSVRKDGRREWKKTVKSKRCSVGAGSLGDLLCKRQGVIPWTLAQPTWE